MKAPSRRRREKEFGVLLKLGGMNVNLQDSFSGTLYGYFVCAEGAEKLAFLPSNSPFLCEILEALEKF